jgi:hypothetical protein
MPPAMKAVFMAMIGSLSGAEVRPIERASQSGRAS